MAQGIWSGIGLGVVFSLTVAGVVSLLVPIDARRAPEMGEAEPVASPETPPAQPVVTVTTDAGSAPVQPQVSLRTPAGEELPSEPAAAALPPQFDAEIQATVDQTPLETAPVTPPATQTAALTPQPRPLPVLEHSQSDEALEIPAAPPQPQTGSAASLTQPRALPPSASVEAGADTPVLPNPQALAPMIPDADPDHEIATEAEPSAPTELPTPAPSVPEQPAAVEAAELDTQERVVTAPKPRVLPSPGAQSDVTVGTPVRPGIGRPASSLITRNDQGSDDAIETVTQAVPSSTADASPIRRNAQPFENPEGKPLMSIVLMDTGADLDAAEIGLPALSSFPYPISFAVDVTLADAAQRAERYRAEGFDVLAMVDLPQGARPTDAEVTMDVALNAMPQIVGVLEGTGEGLQGSREVADQVTRILQASGHGLVTQNRGLNSMPKLAVKEGVPAAPVFRDFDSEGQQPRVIRRFLDQAAFKAGQEGGVIMLGRLRPETIEALLVWGLADRAGSVALAPVSAVLLEQ